MTDTTRQRTFTADQFQKAAGDIDGVGMEANEYQRDDMIAMLQHAADLAREQEQRLKEWRCFHCDFVTTNEAEARSHFGQEMNEEYTPRCYQQALSRGAAAEALLAQVRAELAFHLMPTNQNLVNQVLVSTQGNYEAVSTLLVQMQALVAPFDLATIQQQAVYCRNREPNCGPMVTPMVEALAKLLTLLNTGEGK